MLLLWISGVINLWFYEIDDIADNVEDYNLNLETINGKYSVTIDLSDPKSNEGKLVYDDGNNQIYVSEVIVEEGRPYEVYFRSSGNYNFRRATLVSAVEHTRVQDGFTYNFKANAYSTYQNHSFKIYESSSSSLNFNDGDAFGLNLIPEDDEGVTIDISKDSIVQVTFSNLILHKWERN